MGNEFLTVLPQSLCTETYRFDVLGFDRPPVARSWSRHGRRMRSMFWRCGFLLFEEMACVRYSNNVENKLRKPADHWCCRYLKSKVGKRSQQGCRWPRVLPSGATSPSTSIPMVTSTSSPRREPSLCSASLAFVVLYIRIGILGKDRTMS
jgi:hypothetical protein